MESVSQLVSDKHSQWSDSGPIKIARIAKDPLHNIYWRVDRSEWHLNCQISLSLGQNIIVQNHQAAKNQQQICLGKFIQ